MILRGLLLAAVISALLLGCSGNTDSCAESKSMADGESVNVSVEVVTKPGLGANIVGTLDVNGGLYTTPAKDLGPETDLPVGTYDGVVRKHKGDLTLDIEDESLRLSGPEDCD